MRQVINPHGVFDSTRFGFIQAVVAPAGRRVHLSGQVAVDADLRTIGTTLEEQTARTFDNLETVLEAAAGTLDDAVILRIYIVERAAHDLAPIGRILGANGSPPPLQHPVGHRRRPCGPGVAHRGRSGSRTPLKAALHNTLEAVSETAYGAREERP